jgi:hypothetical protein
VLKVAILAEKYASDYTWYVDVILKLISTAGDYVSEEVWYRVIQVRGGGDWGRAMGFLHSPGWNFFVVVRVPIR